MLLGGVIHAWRADRALVQGWACWAVMAEDKVTKVCGKWMV
jgi:hypothetical protein